LNTGVLYYRIDLLKKYGYKAPPETWEELSRMALRIQQGERQQGKADFWGYIWQGGAYEGLTCNALEWQVSYGGGHIIERNGASTIDNPHAVRAMRTAASWVGSISPESILSYTESDTMNAFNSGRAAFMRHWSSAFRGATEGTRAGPVGVAPLPSGPGGRANTLGGFHLAVSRYSAHPQQAAELVLYLTGTEVEKRRALARGYIPTYPQLYTLPNLVHALPQSRVLQSIDASSWVVRPSTVTADKYADVSKAYYQSVHQILTHEIPADVALTTLAQRLAKLTGLREGTSGRKNGR
jgi:trehalose/maltose transport system substrate-binding protein